MGRLNVLKALRRRRTRSTDVRLQALAYAPNLRSKRHVVMANAPHVTTLFRGPSLWVLDYQCRALPHDPPFAEQYGSTCLAFVRQGSFGCRVGAQVYDLIPGSVLVGRQGDEYTCTHAHHLGGDRCLSMHFTEELSEELAHDGRAFRSGSVAPQAALGVTMGLVQAALAGHSDVGVDEAVMWFTRRFVRLGAGLVKQPPEVQPQDRKRSARAALWIAENAERDIDLAQMAREVGLSTFHFARIFSRVLGITPHQYLVRTRLQNAARALARDDDSISRIALSCGFADLSNFVRSFRRALGASPRAFRKAARGERKILHERARTFV